jgi:alpha-L-arabinofuranosidase
MEIINPATEALIAALPEDTRETVAAKYQVLKAAQPGWSGRGLTERIALVRRFQELLGQEKETLGTILTSEVGKPLSQSYNEIGGAVTRIEWMLRNAGKYLDDEWMTHSEGLGEKISYEPLGVVCNISAWNYPYLVGVNVFIPALIAGNAVLYKPSEYATLTGLEIAKLLTEAGIPADVFQVAVGGKETGELLLDMDFDGYFFTGSYQTGKYIYERVSHKMVPCQLELGGKDPLYVAGDITDIPAVAAGTADGAFYNNGQSCCAVERIYVHEDVYDAYVEAFVKEVTSWKMGPPTAEGVYIGALTRKAQMTVLDRQIKEALDKGATLLCGGHRKEGKGYYYEPTVLANVRHDMQVMREESFGPVIGIMKVKDDVEAVGLMQDTPYGLTAAVYSAERERAERILRQVNAGTGYWNCCDRVSAALPWSGRKHSGIGATLSHQGLRAFTRPKAWHLKGLVLPLLLVVSCCLGQATLTARVSDTSGSVQISRFIYGQFAEDLGRCIYDGFWVNDSIQVPRKGRIRLDVVSALRRIRIPDLRWPGGCFADQYHWSDGIGPTASRPTRVNTTWGMVTDDNSFGTNEFLDLCQLIGCEPYIAGNVGTGSPREMENWLEYLNYNGQSTLSLQRAKDGHLDPYKVAFWGVGNESWGCGGNMTPEFYADQFKRYAEFCKDYPGAPLKKIASGPNADDYHWTEVCMQQIPSWDMYGLSLHYYTLAGPWSHKGSATQFGEDEYFAALQKCLFMDTLIARNAAIMDKYDPEKKVSLCVDEWGIWTDPEPGTNPAFLYQQNSLRDALIAATTLNIFNNHAERVRMANLAQTVNVLQSLILTKGSRMLLTPTYHVFDLYKVHQDARRIPVTLVSPSYTFRGQSIAAVNASASSDKDGVVHVSLVNLNPSQTITVAVALPGMPTRTLSGLLLTSHQVSDINTFEQPDKIHPVPFTQVTRTTGGGLTVALPPASVVVLELK